MKKIVCSFVMAFYLLLLLGMYFGIDYGKVGLTRTIWISLTFLSSFIVSMIAYILTESKQELVHEKNNFLSGDV